LVLLLVLHEVIVLLLRSGLITVIFVFVSSSERMTELVFCCTAGRWVFSSLGRLMVLIVGRLLEHHGFTLGVVLLERSGNANLVSSVCDTSLLE
jgi:hypothetical protein